MEHRVLEHEETTVVVSERIVTPNKPRRNIQMLLFGEFSTFIIPNQLENALTIRDKEESSI